MYSIYLLGVHINFTTDAELYKVDDYPIKEEIDSDSRFQYSTLIIRWNKEVEFLNVISELYQTDLQKALFCLYKLYNRFSSRTQGAFFRIEHDIICLFLAG